MLSKQTFFKTIVKLNKILNFFTHFWPIPLMTHCFIQNQNEVTNLKFFANDHNKKTFFYTKSQKRKTRKPIRRTVRFGFFNLRHPYKYAISHFFPLELFTISDFRWPDIISQNCSISFGNNFSCSRDYRRINLVIAEHGFHPSLGFFRRFLPMNC